MSLIVHGQTGTIRWGYHLAASFRAWTVTQDGGAAVLEATVVDANAFRLSQQPLVCQARHATGAWTWPIVSLQIVGASLTATFGPRCP